MFRVYGTALSSKLKHQNPEQLERSPRKPVATVSGSLAESIEQEDERKRKAVSIRRISEVLQQKPKKLETP